MTAEVIMSYEDFEALKVRHQRLRAALEGIQAMCKRGESHTWIERIARKALAGESYDQAMAREHGPDLIRER